MRNLIVVGNGFDIFHGLKTSYTNFKEYLVETEQSGFVDALEKYIPADELWSSFEYALGCLDYETLQDENNCYLLGYGDDNWRDSAHHDYQMMISEELSFAIEIPHFLREWILSIDINGERKIGEKVISPNDIFISFNYTDTLEVNYNISHEKILYIHGKAKKSQKIIVGHGDASMIMQISHKEFSSEEDREEYIEYMQGADVRELEAQEIIRGYFTNTYKDVDNIMSSCDDFFKNLQGIKNVFVLGHSLAEVDLPYFAYLNSVLGENINWVVTYYREWEREVYVKKLLNIGISCSHVQMCKMNELCG